MKVIRHHHKGISAGKPLPVTIKKSPNHHSSTVKALEPEVTLFGDYRNNVNITRRTMSATPKGLAMKNLIHGKSLTWPHLHGCKPLTSARASNARNIL
jgi:hypothetical protein|tara:strand:- start:20 stop:313 length:294 start_codon:yes stop_codon:yes gene_type:complete